MALMPRQARLDIPGALHHIMVRGINKTAIFRDDQERIQFLDRMGRNIVAAECSIYAWVLMDNHVHLLFRSGKQGISSVMRRLLTWYAQYYNRRHRRTGHLFENRYKSILCDEDAYLLALVRYIHLNPVRAGIVSSFAELDRYPWSGHRAMIGKAKYLWMDTDYVLAQFGRSRAECGQAYRQFVREGFHMGRQPELSGGQLPRSSGRWSQVLSQRRKGGNEEFDQRILGGIDFIHAILEEADERQQRQMRVRRNHRNLVDFIEEECRKRRISLNELRHGSRRSAISRARAEIAHRCKEEVGVSAAEIARHLGVNTSSITRAIERMEITTRT